MKRAASHETAGPAAKAAASDIPLAGQETAQEMFGALMEPYTNHTKVLCFNSHIMVPAAWGDMGPILHRHKMQSWRHIWPCLVLPQEEGQLDTVQTFMLVNRADAGAPVCEDAVLSPCHITGQETFVNHAEVFLPRMDAFREGLLHVVKTSKVKHVYMLAEATATAYKLCVQTTKDDHKCKSAWQLEMLKMVGPFERVIHLSDGCRVLNDVSTAILKMAGLRKAVKTTFILWSTLDDPHVPDKMTAVNFMAVRQQTDMAHTLARLLTDMSIVRFDDIPANWRLNCIVSNKQ
ncbi:hypothetical protein [Red seabream iridovirus]|uniref:ORF099 n=4 Tax=Infectious spleen and kidney necrosis virus TaxID=180170 RepID=A0A218PFL2_RSIV|nr:ORF103L [Orange-spotted grouper iridovirus]AGG37981.1 hypothetical protein [Rock bream iridovirus]AMM72736.1 ORF115L [giant sea perch iridovirus - K1]QIQ54664.1 ORF099 [Red seabream iridovirus]UWH19253.1 hypothetical protein [Infectious spleen and kidney necrosis virus]WBR81587.1 hypothetical protein ORF111L [Spotted knifejaw iridovirus]